MNKKKEKTLFYLSIVLFGISLIIFLWSVYHYRFILDADMSYELILGNLLANENKIFITDSWVYSTNLRFLDIPFVYNVLFRFMKNWTHVHICCILIVNFIVLFLLYRLCSIIEKKKYFYVLAFSFLNPICYDVIRYHRIGLYYLVYIIYTLCTINLFLKYDSNKKNINLILLFVSSIIFSLEGVRILAVIYIPLLLAIMLNMFFNKKIIKEHILFCIIALFGCGIGFIINKELLLNYLPNNAISVTKINFIITLESIIKLFKYLFFGDKENLILNFLSIVIILFSLVCSVKNIIYKKKDFLTIVSLYYVISLFIVCATCLFTNVGIRQHYILQSTIYTIPIIIFSLAYDYNNKMLFLSFVIIISSFILGIDSYTKFYYYRNHKQSLVYISEYLVENGYFNGYSTSWDSSLMTEFSNGQIDVWNWGDSYYIDESFKDIDRVYMFLQKTSHYNHRPQGKCFIVLDNYYRELLKDLQWNFKPSDVLLDTGDYIVYGFESAQKLYEIVNNQ